MTSRADTLYISPLHETAINFGFFSSTGKSAFQGQGYIWRNSNKYVPLCVLLCNCRLCITNNHVQHCAATFDPSHIAH